jgi:hypothetical protein
MVVFPTLAGIGFRDAVKVAERLAVEPPPESVGRTSRETARLASGAAWSAAAYRRKA